MKNPRIILIIAGIAALLMLAAAFAVTTTAARKVPAPPPTIEWRTWERPIPVASQECLKSNELAGRAIDLGMQLDEKTTAAMADQRRDKLSQALTKFKEAGKLADDTKKARLAWATQSAKCKTSGGPK